MRRVGGTIPLIQVTPPRARFWPAAGGPKLRFLFGAHAIILWDFGAGRNRERSSGDADRNAESFLAGG
jgi:hypothetical protein